MSDLKPCPFCGEGLPYVMPEFAAEGVVSMRCRGCGCLLNFTSADAWNTRPGEDAARREGYLAGLERAAVILENEHWRLNALDPEPFAKVMAAAIRTAKEREK